MNKANNDFLNFFIELKSFLIQHGLAKSEMFSGLSFLECEYIEKKNNLKLDLSLRSFLQVFGGGITIPEFNNSSLFTMSSITEAYSEINLKLNTYDRNVIELIQDVTSLDSLIVNSLKKPLNSIILLKYDSIGDSYILVEECKLNPLIYTYYDYSNSFFFNGSRLTEHLRSLFSRYVVDFCNSHNWDKSNESIGSLLKLDWIQFYEMIDKQDRFWVNYSRYRSQFRQKNHENLNFDFSGGEERFINYLLDNKII